MTVCPELADSTIRLVSVALETAPVGMGEGGGGPERRCVLAIRSPGLGDDFKGLFPGVKLANRGISMDTTRGMLIRLEQDVLSLKPAAVDGAHGHE